MRNFKFIFFVFILGIGILVLGSFILIKVVVPPQVVLGESLQSLTEKRGNESQKFEVGEEKNLEQALALYWLYNNEEKDARKRSEDGFAMFRGKLTRMGSHGVELEPLPLIESSALLYIQGCTADIFYMGKEGKVQKIIHGLEDC